MGIIAKKSKKAVKSDNSSKSKLAVTSLILGILSILFVFASFKVIGVIVGILLSAGAITTGVMSFRKKMGTGMAVSGIVTGSVGLILIILVGLIFILSYESNAELFEISVHDIDYLDDEIRDAIVDFPLDIHNIPVVFIESKSDIIAAQSVLDDSVNANERIKGLITNIEQEVQTVRDLEYEEYADRIDESNEQLELYTTTMDEIMRSLNTFVEWSSHYTSIRSKIEKVELNEELITSAGFSNNFDDVVSLSEGAIASLTEIQGEIQTANTILQFKFMNDLDVAMSRYKDVFEDSRLGGLNPESESDQDYYQLYVDAIPSDDEAEAELDTWLQKIRDKADDIDGYVAKSREVKDRAELIPYE